MLVVQDGVRRRRPIMLLRQQIFNIFASRGVARVMVMIAVRLCNRIMRIGLVVLELVGVIVFECRVEILLLIGT
jgi:hypothetical protein